MNTVVWLMIASVVAASTLFMALAVFLILILRELGPTGETGRSFLAKIRLGLRAIEIETGHIPKEVTKLNSGLAAIRDGLGAVDANLGRLAAGIQRQERH
ncbi:MAG: hypothetical protein LC804_06835 [Acidobacteria bacterium]|nr:hypothetical protein [Acidobacteriota bacterium]